MFSKGPCERLFGEEIMTTPGMRLTVRYINPDPSSSSPFYSLYSLWVLLFPKIELEYEETWPSMKGQHS